MISFFNKSQRYVWIRVLRIPREAFTIGALIFNGVDINFFNCPYTKRTALMNAAYNGHTQFAQILIVGAALVLLFDPLFSGG